MKRETDPSYHSIIIDHNTTLGRLIGVIFLIIGHPKMDITGDLKRVPPSEQVGLRYRTLDQPSSIDTGFPRPIRFFNDLVPILRKIFEKSQRSIDLVDDIVITRNIFHPLL